MISDQLHLNNHLQLGVLKEIARIFVQGESLAFYNIRPTLVDVGISQLKLQLDRTRKKPTNSIVITSIGAFLRSQLPSRMAVTEAPKEEP